MPFFAGLAMAGLSTAAALSSQRDQAAAARQQYNYQQYQSKRANDAANLKRQYNNLAQIKQREEMFKSAYKQAALNSQQVQDRYSAQVRDISKMYMTSKGAMLSQLERNGQPASSGSGRALTYAALKNASNQLKGVSAGRADADYQIKDTLQAKLKTGINAEAPSLFIQGTPPSSPSSMSSLLGAAQAGLGGFQSGISLATAYADWKGPTGPTTAPVPSQYTNEGTGFSIFRPTSQ